MRYELEPDNRNCPDDVLLGDLRAVADHLGKHSITKDDYNQKGRFSAATMQVRFGSWNAALLKSGLKVQKRIDIPQEELLDDLWRAATELNTKILTVSDYARAGNFSASTITRTFGSWAKALESAGLKVSDRWNPKIPDEVLLSNLAEVWEGIGRQPRKSDMRAPLSKFSADSYIRRYGSWRQSLEFFVASADQPASTEGEIPEVQADPSQSRPPRKRTQRDPSWRLRFLVNRRDRFCCRACGRSPATQSGVILHVDHIVPWSQGGETVLDNLQTLCEICNIGKSDLAMHEDEG